MRRFVAALLIMAMFIPVTAINVSAQDQNVNGVEWFDEGSYILERISTYDSRLSGRKTGSKTYDYYGSDGKLKWSASVFGNFVYTGATSSCTESNVTVSIYDDQWVVVSKQASRNGSVATGEVVMGMTRLGVTVGSVKYSLSLTCDANGNLS